MGVCNLLQWRNRPRISRGSLTLDCIDTGLTQTGFFKELKGCYVPRPKLPSRISLKRGIGWFATPSLKLKKGAISIAFGLPDESHAPS